jgi:hypothetical protein
VPAFQSNKTQQKATSTVILADSATSLHAIPVLLKMFAPTQDQFVEMEVMFS